MAVGSADYIGVGFGNKPNGSNHVTASNMPPQHSSSSIQLTGDRSLTSLYMLSIGKTIDFFILGLRKLYAQKVGHGGSAQTNLTGNSRSLMRSFVESRHGSTIMEFSDVNVDDKDESLAAEAIAIREYVITKTLELNGEAQSKVVEEVFQRLLLHGSSRESGSKYAVALTISALIPVKIGEEATKIQRLHNILRDIINQTGASDFLTLRAAADALGFLVRVGGALTAEIVESETRRSIETMKNADSGGTRRLASALVLTEMANNAPTVFNIHVQDFVEAIWFGLRDQNIVVRDCSVMALRSCLVVVEKRETRKRVQWYYKLFQETQKGMIKGSSGEAIHGSLLAIGELLRHTGEFMLARYKDVAEGVLKFRDSKDRVVRTTVALLLPKVAAFSPERFTDDYLPTTMQYLFLACKSVSERPFALIAIGRLTTALMTVPKSLRNFQQYFSQIAAEVRDVIQRAKRKEAGVPEALDCVGAIAVAAGESWRPNCEALLDTMFSCGLCEPLVDALNRICSALPSTSTLIHSRLLDMLCKVLAKQSFNSIASQSAHLANGLSEQEFQSHSISESNSETRRLALRTLSCVEFAPFYGPHLLQVAKKVLIGYLNDSDGATRRDAALTCCSLVERFGNVTAEHVDPNESTNLMRGAVYSSEITMDQKQTMSRIIERIVVVAVADQEVDVRRDVLRALRPVPLFDEFLAQGDLLRALFMLLNDEDPMIRELATSICGRLSSRNPAYVLPALRRQLMQLLIDLDHTVDGQQRQQSAKLLTCMVKAAPRLILPYVAPVMKALISKLKEGVNTLPQAQSLPIQSTSMTNMIFSTSSSAPIGNSGLQIEVLQCVGYVASVGGTVLSSYIHAILPLVIAALRDSSAAGKREVAVVALGKIIEHTGYVMAPYSDYPNLLGILLQLLEENSSSTRFEVMRVIGTIGALDTHAHKRNQARLSASSDRAIDHATEVFAQPHGIRPSLSSMFEDDVLPSGVSAYEDLYYPTIAIRTLMKILSDVSMASHHTTVVRSLIFIFQSQGLASVQYLPKVMPVLFHVLRTGEEPLRELIFQQLTKLVSISKNHIRKYLPDLLNLVREYWTVPVLLLPILQLLENLSIILQDEFRVCVPPLLPKIIGFLVDAERANDWTTAMAVLHSLDIIGMYAESVFMLIPTLTRLISPDGTSSKELQRAALRSLSRLIPRIQISNHASMIIHALRKLIESGHEDLRGEAVDVLHCVAQAMGSDFQTFVPMTQGLLAKYDISHRGLESTIVKLKQSRSALGPDVVTKSTRPYRKRLDSGEDSLGSPSVRLHLNQNVLKSAWDSGNRSTKEDWTEWMRHLSVELLKESPSPALRACCTIAQVQPHVARELFPAGFLSCWSELVENYQDQLVRSLEAAFAAPTIPPEIVATLLNLAEFMEHDEKPLPIDIKLFGALAEKCHAYAKALYYKEQQFKSEPEACIEKLIHINNQLNQPEAASGMLAYAQKELKLELKENLFEKLQRWSEALEAYRRKLESSKEFSAQLEAKLGMMRCLSAMSEWSDLSEICKEVWDSSIHNLDLRQDVAPIAAQAAWKMGDWSSLESYTDALASEPSSKGISTFYAAILDIHAGKYESGREHVAQCRECLGQELPALAGESYERAYPDMIRVQQLSELEEVIEYSLTDEQVKTTKGRQPSIEGRRAQLRQMWRSRLVGVQRSMSVWQQLLSIRQLVVPMQEDPVPWEKYANLCLKSGYPKHGMSTLIDLLGYDPRLIPMDQLLPISGHHQPSVLLTFLKHLYASGEQEQAFMRLEELTQELRTGPYISSATTAAPEGETYGRSVPLLARAFLKLGQWRWQLASKMSDAVVVDVLTSLKASTDVSMSWGKAWHTWALFNISAMDYYTKSARNPSAAARHVGPAVTGFFRSIALASSGRRGSESLQDILRLLTLWFSHGSAPDVENAVKEGLNQINIDTWLAVIPQLIARIHTPVAPVRNLLHSLLIRIGREHPQELIYPLLVACESQSPTRRAAANTILNLMREHSPKLVEQAQLVSKELIRVAILWHEQWHESLEEASRQYFGDHDVSGMLRTLSPLHEKLEQTGPETLNETSFLQAYGRELAEAAEWCRKYQLTENSADLNQAWDLYYQVFKKINKQLPGFTSLELQYVSPALVHANNLLLAIPGTHVVDEDVITIQQFHSTLNVISSKQRPRKLTITGSNGMEYTYLLKGHEDLRQDERVMQLTSLINTLLAQDRSTSERNLSIARYPVIPLSPNSGLIGWVPNCDTLHSLIREYREARKIALNLEHRMILAMAADYDQLPLLNKVEVFQNALDSTDGNDLEKVIWLKSKSSEVWLDKRTNFTRSLAVMSMVGYVLGLGDRHPSNLMMDRNSGKILHIDFGDCFEASMLREKFPERVPFRLTRMLVKAMEVCGTEGTFRYTCESVMQVMRTNKDSVMAMLEAFVHDPLINWRLATIENPKIDPDAGDVKGISAEESVKISAGGNQQNGELHTNRPRGLSETLSHHTGGPDRMSPELEDTNELLNERAVAVMQRMNHKLTGRDGGGYKAGPTEYVDSVPAQVERLIQQATSQENLCQAYIGWCAFW